MMSAADEDWTQASMASSVKTMVSGSSSLRNSSASRTLGRWASAHDGHPTLLPSREESDRLISLGSQPHGIDRFVRALASLENGHHFEA